MATWFCCGCHKNIGDNQYCPYCGMHRFGKYASIDTVKKPRGILSSFFSPILGPSAEETKREEPQKAKKQIFSEEECFLYGIHPDDEMYRKTMELNILSKNYKE